MISKPNVKKVEFTLSNTPSVPSIRVFYTLFVVCFRIGACVRTFVLAALHPGAGIYFFVYHFSTTLRY